MRAHRDPDLVLVEEMLAPPPLDEARSALAYWERRRKGLPVYRRAARREAKVLATRWQERVRDAEAARFASSPIGRVLLTLGVPRRWLARVRIGKRTLFVLAWTLVPRRLKLVAGGFAAAGLLVMAAAVASLAVLLAQLA
jgi:hypothetical protein